MFEFMHCVRSCAKQVSEHLEARRPTGGADGMHVKLEHNVLAGVRQGPTTNGPREESKRRKRGGESMKRKVEKD